MEEGITCIGYVIRSAEQPAYYRNRFHRAVLVAVNDSLGKTGRSRGVHDDTEIFEIIADGGLRAVRLRPVGLIQVLHIIRNGEIRLGTFESGQAEKAFKEEPLLKEKEIEIVPRQVSPATTWYRLYAGKFDTMEEAFKTTQDLRKKGLLPALKK